MKTGSCLCGAVKFEVEGDLRPVLACHCWQCRKQTGSYMSATAAADKDLKMMETRGLKWFRSSPEAQRGFCGECGSVLFWKADGSDSTSITAGSIDGKTDTAFEGHIFLSQVGDYYEVSGPGYRKDRW
ncbi:GFA family protein [Aestuariivirga sp.]|uniref:GFA family protein n=1 Tax=Aestuariivirga sp. TaxID=2650926 RepID=UPI0039E26041